MCHASKLFLLTNMAILLVLRIESVFDEQGVDLDLNEGNVI